jgi:Family of unknown function (DUF6788)
MRTMETQSLSKDIPDRLPGAVCKQYVKCGTPNCRCTRGELHGPYWYRFWRNDEGKLHRQYVRKADLERVRAACAARQAEEAEVRWALGQADDVFALLVYEDDEMPIERQWEVMENYPRVLQILDDAVRGRKGSVMMGIRAFDILSPAAAYLVTEGPSWLRPNPLVELMPLPHPPRQPDDESFAIAQRTESPDESGTWQSFTGTVSVPPRMLPNP